MSDIPLENRYICLSWVFAKTRKLLNIFHVPLVYIQEKSNGVLGDYSYAALSLVITQDQIYWKKNH